MVIIAVLVALRLFDPSRCAGSGAASTVEQEVTVPVDLGDKEDVLEDGDRLPLMEPWQMNSTESF